MLEPRIRTVPASKPGQRRRSAHEAPVAGEREPQRNRLVVAMLAYGGLRPVEDGACTWRDLRERSLHVFATKTGRPRDVDLLARHHAGDDARARIPAPRPRRRGDPAGPRRGLWDALRTHPEKKRRPGAADPEQLRLWAILVQIRVQSGVTRVLRHDLRHA